MSLANPTRLNPFDSLRSLRASARRHRASEGHMQRFGLVFLAALLSATTLLGSPHKTPWGDPDLQGIWSNQTPTPLERPDALAGKTTLTEAEAAEFEKTSLERLLTMFAREVPISGELNGIWLETAKGKVPPGRSTSLVVDPPDGKVPFTPEGKKRWDAVPKIGMPMKADVPEDRTVAERCITTDGLLLPNPFYNNYFEIVQAPGHVAIVTEMMHETRVIPLDRRPHVGAGVRMWSGDSRGWWEGETLVVETTNFNDKKLFRGATAHLQTVERFTRLDADSIEYRLTVTDPATFERPWTLVNGLRRGDGGIYEVACHEGNIGLRGILAGARVQEGRQP
jgi:hypothetical protein